MIHIDSPPSISLFLTFHQLSRQIIELNFVSLLGGTGIADDFLELGSS